MMYKNGHKSFLCVFPNDILINQFVYDLGVMGFKEVHLLKTGYT